MRRMRALWAGAALAAWGLLCGCQSYEFVPISPRAVGIKSTRVLVTGKPLPSNVMLVVDKSGSMTDSVTGTGLSCTVDGLPGSHYDPLSANPCKWNDLKQAFTDPVDGFLVQNQGLARFGLLAFPGEGGSCTEGEIGVPIGDDVGPIRDQLLNQLAPLGGTPTTAALLAAAEDPGLAGSEPNRKRFVMLLTDGLPNCNDANAALCADCRANPGMCNVEGACRPTESPNWCDPLPFEGAACLDEQLLVDAIAGLRARGIVTLVIGFGSDTATGNATRVLNRAALEGGHPREGAAESYYQANSVEELRSFLEELLRDFPCTYRLDPPPSDPELVTVNVHDTRAPQASADRVLLQGADWEFGSEAMDAVRLLGGWCDLVQNAEYGRYEVQIVYAEPL